MSGRAKRMASVCAQRGQSGRGRWATMISSRARGSRIRHSYRGMVWRNLACFSWFRDLYLDFGFWCPAWAYIALTYG